MKKENNLEEVLEKTAKAFESIRVENEERAKVFWDSLSYEDRCNAFHAVVSRLAEGELEKKGSYRYILYDLFGFGPEMYARGMDCGFIALHNSIKT